MKHSDTAYKAFSRTLVRACVPDQAADTDVVKGYSLRPHSCNGGGAGGPANLELLVLTCDLGTTQYARARSQYRIT